jgi:hypothetical protein
MVALPDEIAVSVPPDDTCATAIEEDEKLILLPVRTLPPASRAATMRSTDAPVTIICGALVTWMVATGTGVTVRVALPTWPSIEAVMMLVPAETVVTTPVESMLATEFAEEVQFGRFPGITPPLPS